MTDLIYAPWSDEEVTALNKYQVSGVFHPFTCGNRGDDRHVRTDDRDLGQLIATRNGWVCPDCDYTQDWAHAFMADPIVVDERVDALRTLGFPI